MWHFPPFSLDSRAKALWRGDEPVPLQAKPTAVLEQLLQHAGSTVTVDMLLRGAWSDVHVTAESVKVCVNKIRRALRDDVRGPRYIETAGYGYRFIGPVTARAGTTAARSAPSLIDRQTALPAFQEHFKAASSGQGRVVFVTGDAGIGKSIVCDWFIRGIDNGARASVGRGRCLNVSQPELFAPVLDAFADLSRTARQPRSIIDQEWASSMTHMSRLLDSTSPGPRRLGPLGGMLQTVRDMIGAIDAMAAHRTVVLVLQDVQWADRGTIEFLNAIGTRGSPSRILVLATTRLDEAPATEYYLARTWVEPTLQGRAFDVAINTLQE